ncbi:hypothetical protein EVAR_53092_1 [Eumeta japonica]|uniref:Thyroglobulin type-1 domain-containing protein n=1 Tax=Eumeta variegata TaxID=151549 RepID=A0A4C1ZHK3_EUMVA|nr:hypothetical protein EVAR_53092_1 [Eumeta japonica]
MFFGHRIYFIVLLFIEQYFYGIATTSQCPIAQVCITDVTRDDCWGADLVPNLIVYGCCPGCGQGGGIIQPEEGCRPPSSCLSNGHYAPVQCKGDHFTGRSMMHRYGIYIRLNSEERIVRNPMMPIDIGYVACSRRRAELEASGRRDVTLHCTPNGDYEPLQCDSGLCWCAEPKTGHPTVVPVSEDDMRRLPCYSSALIGEQYLRRCESTVHGLAVIHREQAEHGTNFLGSSTTFCDYDGSYGPFQIQSNIAYCTGRDGSILGSWQSVSTEMAGMNCNCALDTAVHFPAQGMAVSQSCLANGNYNPIQTAGDQSYCVDSDGYPTDASPDNNCV